MFVYPPTFVNKVQGRADRKLITQINKTIFFAFPNVDLERGDKGRQIARYLDKLSLVFLPSQTSIIFSPFKTESHNCENGSVDDSFSDNYLGVTSKLSKRPWILNPDLIELQGHG